MDQAPKTFTLRDAAGEEHHYTCILHRASEGVGISIQLAAVAARPLLEGLEALMVFLQADEADKEQPGKPKPSEMARMASALEEVDLGPVGAALQQALGTPGLEDIVFRVLAHTTRDRQLLVDDRTGRPSHAFDTAYQGNYVELWQAFYAVVQANRFLPLPGTS